IEGLVLGVDYGGYFTTIAITGTVETLEQFMPLAQEVVKSFRFNESVAKKNSEIIASIGQQVEGEFIEILGE
ncbi:MAG: hypothetical protein LIP23_03170, partial [Planctomycetes bacterium]|nr:hypothetical protein [Planctomycetota bacterium]